MSDKDPFRLRTISYEAYHSISEYTDPPKEEVTFLKPNENRPIHDIISDMLMDPRSNPSNARHVHVFRREYPKCLLKGCHAKNKKFDSQGKAT